MYEIDKNAPIEYLPRARTPEFPITTARGDTEFRSQVFLGASVHGYIFIGRARQPALAYKTRRPDGA